METQGQSLEDLIISHLQSISPIEINSEKKKIITKSVKLNQFPCQKCGHQFRLKMGLEAHLRTHVIPKQPDFDKDFTLKIATNMKRREVNHVIIEPPDFQKDLTLMSTVTSMDRNRIKPCFVRLERLVLPKLRVQHRNYTVKRKKKGKTVPKTTRKQK